jgi:hypothetical protein
MRFFKRLKLLSFMAMFILFGNVYAALPSNGTYTFAGATNNGNGTYTTSDGFFLISTSSAKGAAADQYGAFVRYFDEDSYQIEATSAGTDYIEVLVVGGGSFKLTGGVFGEFDQSAEQTYNNFTNVYVAGYANGVEVVRTASHNSPTYETNYNLNFSTPSFSNYVIDKVRVYFTYTTSERPAQLNLESLNISNASTNPPPPANTAPTITGAVASQTVDDNATLTPFSGVTLADTESNNLSITITLDTNAKGTLSGTGLSGTGPYTLASDSIANVQAKLRALTFNPTDNRVAPASTETTTFSLVANDGTTNSTTNSTTTVISTSVNDAPTITSTAVTSVNQESSYSYALGASDADGDSLTWSVKSGTSLPSWLELKSGDTNLSTWIENFGEVAGIGYDKVTKDIYVTKNGAFGQILFQQQVEVYKITSNGNQTLFTTLPFRQAGSMVVHDGYLYLGGLNNTDQGYATVQRYDLSDTDGSVTGETVWQSDGSFQITTVLEHKGYLYINDYDNV